MLGVTAALAGLGAGCVASSPSTWRGYPLYPPPAAPLAVSQVARLSALLPVGGAPSAGATSFIRAVDGREVSTLDRSFELLPGCHVVETARQLVIANENMTWAGVVDPLAFVFQMKPGYEYQVVVEMAEGMGGTARLSISGAELDATGKRTAAVPPAAPGAARCGPVARAE